MAIGYTKGKGLIIFYYVLLPLTLAYQVLNDSLILLSTFLIFYIGRLC